MDEAAQQVPHETGGQENEDTDGDDGDSHCELDLSTQLQVFHDFPRFLLMVG